MNHITRKNQDSRELLAKSIEKIDGAYAYSTIRAYKADFIQFIEFCEERNEGALPTKPLLVVDFITQLSNGKRSSASIRRAICGIRCCFVVLIDLSI